MRIRPARDADALEVARIHVHAWQAAYAEILADDYLENLSIKEKAAYWERVIHQSHAKILVAESPDGIQGWIVYGPARDPDALPGTGEIHAFYVCPKCWGQGIGHELWQECRSRLVALRCKEVTLWLLEGNQRAARFYESLGFAYEFGSRQIFRLGGREVAELRYRKCLGGPEEDLVR
ncbi:GNAT family N-acetyltransferase [Halomonas binhaiensis]|uniref:GNAT family N-acetyltransferase n=1 Tax=Halomonas binhaiensis TaxID=2562282 RepID=A0A856QKZ6_9GAMM|nr:GNAT family N-acetyltransferase [Halomonas binhaiensis]QEM80597.2 GNAT family N-acetyltransferase [Halomonas binhaiensis]